MKVPRILSTMFVVGATTLLISGCTTIDYKMKVEPDSYNVEYVVSIDRTMLETALVETGTNDTETYIENYVDQLVTDTNLEDTSTKDTVSFSYATTGKVLSERPKNGQELFVAHKSEEELVANIPLHEMLPQELHQVDNLNYVFQEVNVSVSFPGQVHHSNFNGDHDIFSKSVTWDVNDIVESVKKKQPLTAVAASSEFILFNPYVLIDIGALALFSGIAYVAINVSRRKATQLKLKKLAKEEAAIAVNDWDSATPEAWALKQVANSHNVVPLKPSKED